jgi:hypothetical protein
MKPLITVFSLISIFFASLQYSFVDIEIEQKDPVVAKLGNFVRSHTQSHHGPEKTTCAIEGKNFEIRTVPHFIIPGAQKSGTSALYEFLNEHPSISGSPNFETHFFDWHHPADDEKAKAKWLEEYKFSPSLSDDEYQCALRKVYTDNFLAVPEGDYITFEKTPSYLFLRKVPELIESICPWVKIVIILRNPIERAFSHYGMAIRTYNQTFEELVDQEVETMQNIGLSNAPSRTMNYTDNDVRFQIPNLTKEEMDKLHWKLYRRRFANNYLQRSMYITQIQHWMEYFPLNERMLVVNYERFSSHPQEVFHQILYFVGAGPFTPEGGFGTRYNTKKRATRDQIMSPELRRYLSHFFQPYNDQLADLLGEEWRNVWN